MLGGCVATAPAPPRPPPTVLTASDTKPAARASATLPLEHVDWTAEKDRSVVLLVSEGRVFELDAALRSVKPQPRLHGPHLALDAGGVVRDVPQRLRRAPASTEQRTCFPAQVAARTLYACATYDELGAGTLAVLR